MPSRASGAILRGNVPLGCGICGSVGRYFAPYMGRVGWVKADFAAARLTLRRGSRGKVTCLGMAWRRGVRLPLASGGALSAQVPGGWLWIDRKAPPFGPLCERRGQQPPSVGASRINEGISRGPAVPCSWRCQSAVALLMSSTALSATPPALSAAAFAGSL